MEPPQWQHLQGVVGVSPVGSTAGAKTREAAKAVQEGLRRRLLLLSPRLLLSPVQAYCSALEALKSGSCACNLRRPHKIFAAIFPDCTVERNESASRGDRLSSRAPLPERAVRREKSAPEQKRSREGESDREGDGAAEPASSSPPGKSGI